MNILFISSGSDNSGSAHSLVALAKILKEKYRLNVKVVIARKGPIEKQFKNNSIDYYIIRHYTWIKSNNKELTFPQRLKNKIKKIINIVGETRLDKLINDNEIDIVHLNTITTGFGAKTALRNNKRLIWHIREFMDLDLNSDFIKTDKSLKLINQSDAVIAISDSVKKHFSSKLNSTKLIRVYNGIDKENYKDKANNVLKKKIITLTIAGRLAEPKGHIDAIKATSNLIKKGYNVKLQIVGNGDLNYENQLKKLIIKHDIKNEVKFLGYIADIHNIWTKTDIALICSKAEAFGRVTVEAMMGGAIVVGADTKGTAELIGSKYGYTYRQGDSNDLSNVIEYAINNKKYSQTKANLAREYAFENLTATKNADNIYNLYKKIKK